MNRNEEAEQLATRELLEMGFEHAGLAQDTNYEFYLDRDINKIEERKYCWNGKRVPQISKILERNQRVTFGNTGYKHSSRQGRDKSEPPQLAIRKVTSYELSPRVSCEVLSPTSRSKKRRNLSYSFHLLSNKDNKLSSSGLSLPVIEKQAMNRSLLATGFARAESPNKVKIKYSRNKFK